MPVAPLLRFMHEIDFLTSLFCFASRTQTCLSSPCVRMYRSKKEVDRYVIDLDRSLKNEVERGLKSLTVAKLYYNVGDYQSALNSLDKYDLCRKNSAQSLRLRGQVKALIFV
jgi:hypothetical protein